MKRERITDPHITSIDLRGAMPGSHIVIVGCDSLERLWLPECAAGLRVELYLRDQVQDVLVHGDVSGLRGGLRRRFRTRLDFYPNPSGDGVFVRATHIRMSLEFLERPGVVLPWLAALATVAFAALVVAFLAGDDRARGPLRAILIVIAVLVIPVRGGGLAALPALFECCSDND